MDIGVIDIELKSVKSEDPNGAFEAVLSAPSVDRDGEIVDAHAFAPLPERIPIDVDHGLTVESTVGSGRPFYDGDVLKIRGTFASTQRAQDVRALVTEGHISKMSVAFMDAIREDGEDGLPHVKRAELLNAAIVAVPSNRDANILAAKALLKVGARNSGNDGERLQQIHDLSVDNGADCKGQVQVLSPTAMLSGESGTTYTINVASLDPATARESVVKAIREYERKTSTNPEPAAAPAAAAPAEVSEIRALVALAEAQAALL